jgi:hypothetical protein
MMRRVCRVLLVGIALSAALGGFAGAKPPPREVPANVAIHDLLESPDQYDGRRVVVTGFISSIAFEQGRRGSEYAVIMLEEAVTDAPPTAYAVTVISLTMPKVGQCQPALVQGVYHREGKQAGRPYEFFIDAEAILPNDRTDSGRVPSECEQKL